MAWDVVVRSCSWLDLEAMAGYDVVTVTEAELTRKPDRVVFKAAIASDRLVITSNCDDFVQLAKEKLSKQGIHPGVLLVYLHNAPTKDMTYDEIVKAIDNLETIQVVLENGCHKLNDYKW